MLFASLVGLALLQGCGGEALGDRTFTVPLSYRSDSNHGPKDATGTAVIVTGTGKVTITVQKLPMLTKDRYEGWLAGGGEDAVSTAKFNTDASGVGKSEITLGDITERLYEKVILTVEPEPDPTPAPDPRHSISGAIE